MNTTRSLFTLSIAASAFVLAACSDGAAPKIKSFQASTTALPEGGAPVTFTWDVKHAKSLTLEPYPGAVTGTSATVVVTDPTTFTLTAKNGSKKDRRKISFTVGEAFVVTAQAVDQRGRGVPAVQVFVDDDFYVTDENGYFTASGVVPPYDLGWIDTSDFSTFGGSGSIDVVVYRGVTRSNPVMLVDAPDVDFDGTADFSGTVSGGVGFPYPTPTPDPGFVTDLEIFAPEGSAGWGSTIPSTGNYNGQVYWPKPPLETPIIVGALQWQTVPTLTYTGFGRQQAMVTHLGSFDIDVVMNPVSTGSIGASLDAPWTINSADFYPSLDLGPAGAPTGTIGGGFPQLTPESYGLPYANLTSSGSVTLPVPMPPGASYSLYVYATNDDGYAGAFRYGIAEGESVAVDVTEIPVLLSPLDGATVGPGTVFNVNEVDGAIYQFEFESEGFGGPAFGGFSPDLGITVFTNSRSISFPDDLDLGGVDLDGRFFDWTAGTLSDFAGIDGYLEAGGAAPDHQIRFAYSDEQRYFTYGDPIAPF